MSHPDYVIQEFEWAAEDLARKGLTGKDGDPLPNLMSIQGVEYINDHRDDFQQRIRQCAYALAMNKYNPQED